MSPTPAPRPEQTDARRYVEQLAALSTLRPAYDGNINTYADEYQMSKRTVTVEVADARLSSTTVDATTGIRTTAITARFVIRRGGQSAPSSLADGVQSITDKIQSMTGVVDRNGTEPVYSLGQVATAVATPSTWLSEPVVYAAFTFTASPPPLAS